MIQARCGGCDRRLFDVTRQAATVTRDHVRYRDPDYNPGHLIFKARPGRRLDKWRGRVHDRERGVNYSIDCPCGRSFSVRADVVWDLWQQRRAEGEAVTVRLGHDL